MIGIAMAGGNSKSKRKENDFYPTPDAQAVVNALLRQDHYLSFSDKVWEPACGDGALSEAILQFGLNLISTDLIYRGYGEGNLDFLATNKPLANAIVTNPPFNLAEAFIRHAWLNLQVDYMALLLKATYWHAATRRKLFIKCRPSAIYPLTWRLDFMGQGRPTMETAWFVWKRDNQFPTVYLPLFRPTDLDLRDDI